MDEPVRTGKKNSIRERFAPDLRSANHISFMHVREVNADWTYPSHEHKQYEMNYVLRGTQTLMINGRSHRLESGDLALIRPGDIHSSSVGSADGLAYFCLHFELEDPSTLQLLMTAGQTIISGDSPMGTPIRHAVYRLADWVASEDRDEPTARAGALASFYELLAKLCASISAASGGANDGKPPPSETARRIESLIHAAVKQPVYHGHPADERPSIRSVAGQLGISESHCQRLFKQAYGVSPRRYLSELIREEAMRLLGDTPLSVDHVSSLLGYRDIAHFSRQFKRWTGLSPREYRRRIKLP